jgi:diguanylate cyclase (GGDEF)-like protein/PAS domain S-box-containing protein
MLERVGVSVVDFGWFFRRMPTAYLVMTADLVIVDANDAYLAVTGRPREDLLGRPVFDAFPPTTDALDEQGRNPVQVSFERARDTGQVDVMPLHRYDIADPVTGAMGERFWSLISAPLPGPDGASEFVLQRVEDITDWMRTMTVDRSLTADPAARILAVEAELFSRVQELRAAREAEQLAIAALQAGEARARASEAQMRAVLDTAADGIITTDDTGVVVSVNPAAERMFNRTGAEMVGRPLSSLIPVSSALDAPTTSGTPPVFPTQGAGRLGEVVGVRGDGGTIPIELSLGAVMGERLVTVVLRDITERKQMEEQLEHQLLHDPLTGLANRTLLRNRLEHAVARLQRHPGVLAVLFIDLDGFKAVNDTWGHGAGDELLTITAARLRHSLRAEDLAARWGGDEFVVVCEEISHPDDAQAVATRIATALGGAVQLGHHAIRPAASIGVVVDDGTRSVDELIAAADRAMYDHKQRRRGTN